MESTLKLISVSNLLQKSIVINSEITAPKILPPGFSRNIRMKKQIRNVRLFFQGFDDTVTIVT